MSQQYLHLKEVKKYLFFFFFKIIFLIICEPPQEEMCKTPKTLHESLVPTQTPLLSPAACYHGQKATGGGKRAFFLAVSFHFL